MKKILITGASGFIGSHLVERALNEEYETWAAVRPSSSRRYLGDERIHFIELDYSDRLVLCQQLEKHLQENGGQGFDYVIHAAGATKCLHADDFFRINAEGTQNFALALLSTKALKDGGRFVFISSLSIMGAIHEKTYRPATENDFPIPNTAYGESKFQAESYLSQIEGLNFVVLRPTGVYGPRERDYAMMADSIRKHVDFAVGYKKQVLTFIYVADLVNAAFLALTHGESGRRYFLTDGGEYSSRAFSDLIQQQLGVRHVLHLKVPLWFLRAACWVSEKTAALLGKPATLNGDKYRIMSQRNWLCDIGPARRELGYTPEWPLSRGVEATFTKKQ